MSVERLQGEKLASFPFDSVTLDSAVTDGIARQPANLKRLYRILDTVIPGGMSIICKGVDRTSDLALLTREGHRSMVGYTLSRSLTWTQLRLLEGL